MGIETAAALGTAAAAGGTAAAGAGALTAAELAAATATAAGGATAASAAGTAAGLGAAGAAAAGEAAAAGATAAGASGIGAGTIEAANLVGAAGGDALGAFISANQGFGTMTAAQSLGGMADAVMASPILSGAKTAASAIAPLAASKPAPQAPRVGVPRATDPGRVNQNPGLTAASPLMQSISTRPQGANLNALGFADGGEIDKLQSLVPDNIWARTRARREAEAGLAPAPAPAPASTPAVVVNVGDSAKQAAAPSDEEQRSWAGTLLNAIHSMGFDQQGRANGGQIPQLAQHTTQEGKIKGPQSKDGQDNQVVKVAGGEGVIPVDVMDVPGVADLLQGLIQTFHTPVKKG